MAPETLDSLDAENLKPLVVQLLTRIDELLAQNKLLLARIADLEAKLDQPPKTPTNSSLPPSRGLKANVAAAPRAKKGRQGRPRVARALCPNPDATREVYADKCACGAALSPADQPDIFAYDHIDLPPIKPVATRVHLHKGHCPRCKRRVAARPPADMRPGTPVGAGIVALVTYLHACQMVSYARLVEMLDGVFGLQISQGAIANMLARAEAPLAAEADKIAETVRSSPVIASDETSARVCGKNHWQWTFLGSSAVYHTIAPSRGKAVPTAFLGQAKPKVWVSDRLAAHGNHAEAHQYCLAHLMCDAQYAIDAGDTVFAPAFKSFLQDACAVGRRRPELADATIKAHVSRFEQIDGSIFEAFDGMLTGRAHEIGQHSPISRSCPHATSQFPFPNAVGHSGSGSGNCYPSPYVASNLITPVARVSGSSASITPRSSTSKSRSRGKATMVASHVP